MGGTRERMGTREGGGDGGKWMRGRERVMGGVEEEVKAGRSTSCPVLIRRVSGGSSGEVRGAVVKLQFDGSVGKKEGFEVVKQYPSVGQGWVKRITLALI